MVGTHEWTWVWGAPTRGCTYGGDHEGMRVRWACTRGRGYGHPRGDARTVGTTRRCAYVVGTDEGMRVYGWSRQAGTHEGMRVRVDWGVGVFRVGWGMGL